MKGIIDIIEKKKQGQSLSQEEIEFFVNGYVAGSIPDYQISALLMAIYFRGMDSKETFHLTMSMVNSGAVMDLSSLPGITVDKHSTGGIGDKITLILAPLWAATGLTVAKMSGRGLGHTGGTIDKLESIPGFNAALSQKEFLELAGKNHIAITGQSKDLVPADKLLYALRDVTATVDSIPLIASSVMSKKLATGCQVIVLDVKYGRGAFMEDIDAAEALAKAMVDIGLAAGRQVAAVLSPMDHPCGMAVGNSLEILESLDVLSGSGSREMRKAVIFLAAVGYLLGGFAEDLRSGAEIAKKALSDGSALRAFYKFLRGQGCVSEGEELKKALPMAKLKLEILADRNGYIQDIDALKIGLLSMELGAGRRSLNDNIDYGSGVLLCHKVGDSVSSGDVLAVLYSNKGYDYLTSQALSGAEAFVIGDEKPREHGAVRMLYNGKITDIEFNNI
ncbi:MAG: thymidine phosphorylase [Bacillota bacterium]|nr:thymidine phosphorylase [Bacillota bacterium]